MEEVALCASNLTCETDCDDRDSLAPIDTLAVGECAWWRPGTVAAEVDEELVAKRPAHRL